MFDDISMQDKRVLITAGASGLGLEMARVFTAAGCDVFVCDINETALTAARKELPKLQTAVADVSDEAAVDALFAKVGEALGGLDILINNAGIAGPTGKLETLSLADWDRTLSVNITSQFLCARRAIPLLKQSDAGVMINMSSVAGHLGYAGRSPYSSSKWATVGFTKTLAIELGEFGIRVNAILPGAVEGDRIRAVIAAKAKEAGKSVEEMTTLYTQHVSLGRMVTARDIANMALFIASGAAASVSGQALVVDGHTQTLV